MTMPYWLILQVFSKLLDDHTIMAHFSFAQHRIGYRNQRLNSQFSAFSAAQSHSTSGTRHVLLRLRRFSPLSYVNDYWATVQFIRQYKHCEHHAPTNNQDSLTRSICEKAGYDQHNFPHMTPLSHRHRNSHEDIPKLTIHDRSSDAVSHWRRFWWWSNTWRWFRRWSFMSQADR